MPTLSTIIAHLCLNNNMTWNSNLELKKKKHTHLSFPPSLCKHFNFSKYGLPWWLSGKESACQCRRHKKCGFDPWVRKMPWRRKRQPIPVFLPGKFHGERKVLGYSPGESKSRTQLIWERDATDGFSVF